MQPVFNDYRAESKLSCDRAIIIQYQPLNCEDTMFSIIRRLESILVDY